LFTSTVASRIFIMRFIRPCLLKRGRKGSNNSRKD
jgi:hypothetical protein